ncbi:MAG: hypothetical protein QOF78_3328 [Phycisphaerales bacterium]|nr:hypothetical protein [Phycisphaerales bacterium]
MNMSTVEEIKAAIESLDDRQVAELAEWLSHRTDDAWDQQMCADIAGGKLDHLIREAKQSARSGDVFGLPGDANAPPEDKELEGRK